MVTFNKQLWIKAARRAFNNRGQSRIPDTGLPEVWYPGVITYPHIKEVQTTKYTSNIGGNIKVDTIRNPCPLVEGSPVHLADRTKIKPPSKTVLECLTCPYNKRGIKMQTQTIHHFCIALDTMAADFGKYQGLINEFSAALDTWGQYELKERVEIDTQDIDELKRNTKR